MAIIETVRDTDINPGNTKTVTLDQVKIIPIDTDADEIYVLQATSTATDKVTSGTLTNRPIIMREFLAGYSKSSGFTGSSFTITSGTNNLSISIDGFASEEITLTTGTSLQGENIADDIEAKVRAIGNVGGSNPGEVAYLNAQCEFKQGRFWLLSGSISDTYTGTGKSSVSVTSGTNDASELLGFNIPTESEILAQKQPTEVTLASSYTASGGTLSVNGTADFQADMAYTITDGVNREYFIASGVSSGSNEIYIQFSGGLQNNYAAGSVVQKIFERDSTAKQISPYTTIDELVRYNLRAMANQIDFTV